MQDSKPSAAARVLIIDDERGRSAMLEQALADQGYTVVGRIRTGLGLLKAVDDIQPDIIIIDINAPDRDILEHMSMLHKHLPKPVVMFAEDDRPEVIESAIRAGVSAYVVDGMQPKRVRSILQVATARFREYRALQDELEKTRDQLESRRIVDKAKGLLMKHKGMDEDEAYKALRSMAMSSNRKLVEVARSVTQVLELLNT
ncbi:ANTAR domain-containing response regulator [Balneatrix alpica]|uniref:ANTAR domain-containing response regulator n=1 Tax=Balneatrix alpica TaxID=75684 RepID=UPI002738CD35|nr:ANTAR domain-containing protein [Balneatrix alpica]